MSDLHVQGPDMPPERLAELVQRVNQLQPDIVVIAGDFAASHFLARRTYDVAEAIAPLAQLRPRIRSFAVLGNHDRDQDEQTRKALERARIEVLEDEAVQLGPVALGGVHDHVRRTIRRLLKKRGTRILVSHSPDAFAKTPPQIALTLAGHTHCGQVVLPWLGALASGSRFGNRYLCGLVRNKGKILIVSAGLGTSRIPVRIGAPPDLWLVRLRPSRPPR